MHSAVYVKRTKAHHRYPNLSDKQTGWLEAQQSASRDEPPPDAQTPLTVLVRRSNTFDSTGVMEIGR